VYLAVQPITPVPSFKRIVHATPTPSLQQTMLSIDYSSTASVSSSRRKPLAIFIDTKDQLVTASQIELSYDPTILTNIKIAQGSFFDVASSGAKLTIIDQKLGRISYALTEPDNRTVQGKGIIATITYDLSPLALSSSQSATTISFTSKSNVTSPSTSASVLKETQPFTLKFTESLR